MKEYRYMINNRSELIKKSFAIVIGQYSPAVRDRLEAHATWTAIHASLDIIRLLHLIHTSLFSGATSRHTMHVVLIEAQDAFMSFRQTNRMTNGAYFDKFKALLEVYQHLGGDVGVIHVPPDEYVEAADPSRPTVAELEMGRTQARDEYLAIRFLRSSDPVRYGALLADVENSHTRGQDSYPTTLTTMAYEMLVNYVNPNRNSGSGESHGLSFYQESSNERDHGSTAGGRGGRGFGRGRGGGNTTTRGNSNTSAGRPTQQASTNTEAVDSPKDNSQSIGPYSLPNCGNRIVDGNRFLHPKTGKKTVKIALCQLSSTPNSCTVTTKKFPATVISKHKLHFLSPPTLPCISQLLLYHCRYPPS
jgi:hypothetical protein